jgi:site-specific DNA-adenine methylase
MYIDPPYPDNKCNYAHNMRSWEEHILLANKLQKSTCKWALSCYDNEEIRDLFQNFNIIPLRAFSGMKIKKNGTERVMNSEVLITNYNPKEQDNAQVFKGKPVQVSMEI